jgi:hypothetical protein
MLMFWKRPRINMNSSQNYLSFLFVSLWGFRRGSKIPVALVTIASIIIHLRYGIFEMSSILNS